MKKFIIIAALVLAAAGGFYFSKYIPNINADKSQTNKTSKTAANKEQSGDKSYMQNSQTSANTVTQKLTFPAQDPVRAKRGKDKYYIKVKLSEQKVYIYKNGSEIKEMACSTGIQGDKDSETPKGNFKINGYCGQSFFNKKYNEGARYWVGFIGAQYLFHSVPTDKDGNIITAQVSNLGNEASHGCVRLSVDDAYWFYETIPRGSDVSIQD